MDEVSSEEVIEQMARIIANLNVQLAAANALIQKRATQNGAQAPTSDAYGEVIKDK